MSATETGAAAVEASPAPAASNGRDLLHIDSLVKHFPIKAGFFRRTIGQVQRRRRRHARHSRRGDARRRRGVGLRQDDARPDDHEAAGADVRDDRLRRRGHHRLQAEADAGRPPRHPDRLPGPVRLAQPPDDGPRHRRRAAADPRALPARRGSAARGGAPAHGRTLSGAREPLPARVLRRPAAAHRRRARPRAQPAADGARRAGVRARRVHPGAGREPAATSCRGSSA